MGTSNNWIDLKVYSWQIECYENSKVQEKVKESNKMLTVKY